MLAVSAVVLVFASCRSLAPVRHAPAARIAFRVESAAPGGRTLVLPESGVRVRVAPAPLLTGADIAGVGLSPGELGTSLLFRLTPSGVRALTREEPRAAGRRLVLTLNGAPLGARRIDGALRGRTVSIFVEQPETELPALVATLNSGALPRRRREP